MTTIGRFSRLSGPTLEEIVSCLRQDALDRVFPDPEAVMRAGMRGQLPSATVRGWNVKLSAQEAGSHLCWNGSALLVPSGRSSTEEDWAVLGRIVALTGAPKEAMSQISEQIAAGLAPNRPHHWVWTTPASS